VISLAAQAQCGAADGEASRTHRLYEQHEWTAVIDAAEGVARRSADENFEYGMALAHLSRWGEARAALLAGRAACEREKRFAVELAGVAFEQKKYAEAARWLREALKLDAHDEYALNFAGTVYELMGNTDAALKYWNRVGKPYVAKLDVDQSLRLRRWILERAFVFSPEAVLREEQYRATDVRIRGLDLFPVYQIGLQARKDGKFDAEFHAVERDGFGGNRWQALLGTLGGLPYETVYPEYFNAGRVGLNIEGLLRWDSEKERVSLEAAAPLHGLPEWRWRMGLDGRAENWVVRRSFAGAAPLEGSLHLRRAVANASLTSLVSGRMQWSLGAELSDRKFTDVVDGPALNADLLAGGLQAKVTGGVQSLLVDVPEHRFTLEGGASSGLARLWSKPARLYGQLQGEARAHWFPQAVGDTYEVEQQVRAGTSFGTPPFDELWMLGVERDNDLWLRGEIGTRDGRKGSAPLATKYFLSNSDFDRRVYGNGLVTIAAGPLFDVGRAAAPTAGLAPRDWLFSAGAEVKVTVLGVSAVFTYGRDLRAGTNAFYGTAGR
jgi:tetratricopeptide (TPR) repeat protein